MLYNVALLAQFASATAAAAVWASGTFSNGPKPYKLVMQLVSSYTAAHSIMIGLPPKLADNISLLADATFC